MKTTARWLALTLVIHAVTTHAQLLTPAPAALPNAATEAAATLVVYNNLDPESVNLAGYYAQKRQIPLDHLVGLDCPHSEEITREQYDRTIAEPLRRIFAERGWWRVPAGENAPVVQNKIRFVALMRGLPLKIAQDANYPGDSFEGQPLFNTNAAAVDSELATLGYFTRKISGPLPNPYFRSFTEFPNTALPALMLVCRLDAPTAKIVRRMIDDALYAEQNGLWGFICIDARGLTTGGLAEGDLWLNDIAEEARKHGWPVIADNTPALYPEEFPLRNVALYFGWYNGGVCGPFALEDFHFNRGAIACHIHSFSATTLRDPQQNWAAPLLARGAAATLGNVYEPYLTLTPHLDLFFARLRNGFNFAESAYASLRAVSWMTTIVGDPLYRPFAIIPDDAASAGAAEWIAYRHGAETWFETSRAAGETILQKSARGLHSGLVYEGLGLLQSDAGHDPKAAFQSFTQAQQCYTNAIDVLRVALARVQCLRAANRLPEALALARKTSAAFPAQPAAKLFRDIAAELSPKPAASPKP